MHQARDGVCERQVLARTILKGRRRRAASFPGIVFGEPSWDMLLELYAAECAGERLDVTSLCETTGVPKTTALRHLDRLVALGLVERVPDALDGRRLFVHPRPLLLARIERWLDGEVAALDITPL
jgi:DNA-binding MarR family transcriptional regulator